MAQHELLMAVAAPLLVWGRPIVSFLWALPLSWRRALGAGAATAPVSALWTSLTLPVVAWTLHAVAIWLWHAPALYQATLTSDLVHTLQHVSFLGTALLFWWTALRGREGRIGRPAAVLYLFTTSVHTSLLGALLAFSSKLWYPLYASSTTPWGLTPLEDQQLAGLIMWVPAGLTYLIGALVITASWLGESGRRTQQTERVLLLSILLVLLAACGSSHQEQARKLRQEEASWRATLQLERELSEKQEVPSTYARQVVEAADQELKKIRQKTASLPNE
jgi:cytochrome c oxidase assembly factor CtaG